jgi:hypothetical protein
MYKFFEFLQLYIPIGKGSDPEPHFLVPEPHQNYARVRNTELLDTLFVSDTTMLIRTMAPSCTKHCPWISVHGTAEKLSCRIQSYVSI